MQDKIRNRHGIYFDLFTSLRAYKWAVGAWGSINQRTVNGLYVDNPSVRHNRQHQRYLEKGTRVEVSKEEFYRWAANREAEIERIYDSGDKPNVDRIDNDGHYALDNIQILSSLENRTRKSRGRSRKSGTPIYNMVINRRAYLRAMEGLPVKEQPFDTLILMLKPTLVVRIIEASRKEQQLQGDTGEGDSFGPCSMLGGALA